MIRTHSPAHNYIIFGTLMLKFKSSESYSNRRVTPKLFLATINLDLPFNLLQAYWTLS